MSETTVVLPKQTFAMMRAEDEIRHDLALKSPRREEKIVEDAIHELESAPEFAAKSYYSIPHKNDQGGIISVEGPSIKAAMAMARRWGNCVNGARVFDEHDDRVIVEGIFRDYETNMTTVRQISVAKKVWSKKVQQVVPLREDRLNLAIQAGMSKAVRNAILASLPVYFVDQYFKRAKEVATSGKALGLAKSKKELPVTDRIEKAVSSFVASGAKREDIDLYIADMKTKNSTDQQILEHFIGLWNAVTDGMTSVQEIFVPGEPIPKTGEVKSEDLFKNG